MKKVMVSGCFDLLHSGHVAFLESAAAYGELHVCIGNDANILELKNRPVAQNQEERAYMIQALKCVHRVYIDRGIGKLDFLEEMDQIEPDFFVVNHDGDTEEKRRLCQERQIEYVVLPRLPHGSLPARSTTAMRSEDKIPYRIDLAGGWLDQPFVSKLHGGPVITMSIEPSFEVNSRSGMSSSTHNKAKEIWGHRLPVDDPEKLAKILFACDNPPGTEEVSGSQDAIGIVYPGVNCLHYNGAYWPTQIDQIRDEETLLWLEQVIQLIPLEPREAAFRVLSDTRVTAAGAQALALASQQTWKAILQRDMHALGQAVTASLKAQVEMFPLMWNDQAEGQVLSLQEGCHGYKISGAGGGGYLIVIHDKKIAGSQTIQIRRG